MKAWVGFLGLFVSALAVANTSTGGASRVTIGGPQEPRVKLGVSGGLVTVGGDYGGSFLAGVLVRVDRNSNLHLGLDTGLMFGSGTGLPILASIIFPVKEGGVRPYLGAAIGPVIGLSGAGAFKGRDGVRLAILVRPGIRFRVAESLDLNIETSFGGLTGIFYISPMVGLNVLL